MPAPEPIGTRLARKLRQDGDCIVWAGARRPNGYGVIGGSRDAKNYFDSPHRVAYSLTIGPIPTGAHIDHRCRNRLCVNPSHLEAVTQAENNRRANATRWHGNETHAPPTTCTVRDLVFLLTGTRPGMAS